MIILAIAAVLSLGSIGGWLLYHRATLRPGHEEVDRAAARLDELVTDIEALRQIVQRDVELVHDAFAAEEIPDVLGECERLLEQTALLLRRRDELSDLRPRSLWRGDLDTLQSAAERLRTLAETAEQFQSVLRTEDARLGEILNSVSAMSARRTHTRELAASAQRAAAAAREAGFEPADDEVALGVVEERLAGVDQLAMNKQILAAVSELDALDGELAAAEELMRSMHRRTEAAEARATELEAAVARAADRRSAAAEAARILTERYAPTVSEGMSECLAQSERLVQRVARQTAEAFSGLRLGEVRRAERALDDAEEARAQAEKNDARPAQRLQHVRGLQSTLPRRRDELAERLSAVRDRAGQEESAATLGPLADELRAQANALDLDTERPHWLLAERRIDDAEAVAHKLDEHLGALESATSQMRATMARMQRGRPSRPSQHPPEEALLAELIALAPAGGTLHDGVIVAESAAKHYSGTEKFLDEAVAQLQHGQALRRVRRFTEAAAAQAVARSRFTQLDGHRRLAAEAAAELGLTLWALERWDEAIEALGAAEHDYLNLGDALSRKAVRLAAEEVRRRRDTPA